MKQSVSHFFTVIKSIGLIGATRLAFDLLISKAMFPGVRILRRPFYIRNEGMLQMGKGFSCAPGLIIDVFGKSSKIVIGEGVMAYHNLHIGAIDSVIIGNRVLIASGVYISDHSHGCYSGENHSNPKIPPMERGLVSNPVTIGDDTWIGENVSILPGVDIGKGVVIGAGAVVTGNIPDYSIAVGAPARVIKKFDFEKGLWMPV